VIRLNRVHCRLLSLPPEAVVCNGKTGTNSPGLAAFGSGIESRSNEAVLCPHCRQRASGWTPDQFKGLLRQHGIGTGASMRVISDGDDGLRNFVQSVVAPKVTQQLDWFHIGMRLERLRKAVQLPMSYEEFVRDPGLFRPLERRVLRIRDSLWRGRPWRALLHLARLRRDARQWADGTADRYADVLMRLNRAIDEFSGYIGGNRRAVPNFARARAAGRRISTAHVESVMNHLINHRMSKKQQMRWSPSGAHYLLQVRAEVLNGTFLDRYRGWHDRFRRRLGYSPCPSCPKPPLT